MFTVTTRARVKVREYVKVRVAVLFTKVYRGGGRHVISMRSVVSLPFPSDQSENEVEPT